MYVILWGNEQFLFRTATVVRCGQKNVAMLYMTLAVDYKMKLITNNSKVEKALNKHEIVWQLSRHNKEKIKIPRVFGDYDWLWQC